MFDWLLTNEARARIAELENDNAKMKLALDVKDLETDMLHELVENLRQQVRANTAQAVAFGRMHGAPVEKLT